LGWGVARGPLDVEEGGRGPEEDDVAVGLLLEECFCQCGMPFLDVLYCDFIVLASLPDGLKAFCFEFLIRAGMLEIVAVAAEDWGYAEGETAMFETGDLGALTGPFPLVLQS